MHLLEIWDWACVSRGRAMASMYGRIIGWFTFFALCVFSTPAWAKTAVGGDGTCDIKTMYLLQWVAINLNSQTLSLFPRCPPSLLSDSILPFSSCGRPRLLSLCLFRSLHKPSFVWSHLRGLPGILVSGKVIYNTAHSVLTRCDIPQCLHVLPVIHSRHASLPERLMTRCFLISSANEGCQQETG